jgi:hypothetical protein
MQLAKPIELSGKVEVHADMAETVSPVALQRAVSASRSGLDLLSVRLDDPAPLLEGLGAHI